MPARILHNHVGQAEQIDKALKAQLDGQPIKIGHKYVFALPTNGAKLIVVLNSRGFYHMYVPVAVYRGRECLGYAFAEHAERAKDGAMVQKGGMYLFANLWKTKTRSHCCVICTTKIWLRVSAFVFSLGSTLS